MRNHYGPPKLKNVLPCREDINCRCIFLGTLESVLKYVQYALVQFVSAGGITAWINKHRDNKPFACFPLK